MIRNLDGWPQKPRAAKLLRALALLLVCGGVLPAQYDKVAALGSDSSTTPVGGPASAPPLETSAYGLPDFRPTGRLNDHLPSWLQFGLEERLRWDGYTKSGFKPGNNDSYLLNRLRVGTFIEPVSWFRIVAQVQDARP